MTDRSFDAERDPLLGRLLRETLGADDPVFAAAVEAGVLAAVRREQGHPPASSWDWLARWSLPGLAAAALVALAVSAGWVLQGGGTGAAGTTLRGWAEAIRPAEMPSELADVHQAPSPAVVLLHLVEAP